MGQMVSASRPMKKAINTKLPATIVTPTEPKLPHERDEEALLVPLVARALAGTDATAALSRTHAEIEQQVIRLRRLLASLSDDGVAHEDVVALRRLLYGLCGVVRLHNVLEEEGAFSLVPMATST